MFQNPKSQKSQKAPGPAVLCFPLFYDTLRRTLSFRRPRSLLLPFCISSHIILVFWLLDWAFCRLTASSRLYDSDIDFSSFRFSIFCLLFPHPCPLLYCSRIASTSLQHPSSIILLRLLPLRSSRHRLPSLAASKKSAQLAFKATTLLSKRLISLFAP